MLDNTPAETTTNSEALEPIAFAEEIIDKPDTSVNESEMMVQLLEERLVVEIHRRKLGEVIVRKIVDIEMVEVPIRREKLVVEQISPDHRQLAVIDLALDLGLDSDQVSCVEGMIGDRHNTNNQQDLDRQHLDSANSARSLANSSSDHSQSEHSQSTSLAQAAKMLVRLAQNARFREVAVVLRFEDPRLQAAYQQWLKSSDG